MDTIFIKDLAVRGKHGVSDEERAREQGFLIDISIDFDTHVAAKSDELADTVDYGDFRNAAKRVVEGDSFRLLERLADAVAQEVLKDSRISRVAVSLRKTEMFRDCTPGIQITRERE